MKGKLIVFVGLDRSGKSTQASLLRKHFFLNGKKHLLLRFPDRTLNSGNRIGSYLKGELKLKDSEIHLLFALNRVEHSSKIRRFINEGYIVVADRYSASGIAYSVAKGLSKEWCEKSEIHLPKPDIVIYLEVDPAVASKRKDYGKEKYEKVDFQKKVYDAYADLMDKKWFTIDATLKKETIHKSIIEKLKFF